MVKFLKLHFVSLLITLGIITSILIVLPNKEINLTKASKVESVIQSRTSGLLPNLNKSNQDIIDFYASIINDKQLTLFGSSEFNYSDYASYKFFPSKMGKQVFGFGHAHHQHLSILIELLAVDMYLKNSKICIFLSPGWFDNNGGTNPSAFVEFAKPELLNKIITGKTKKEYKNHIGKYIYYNNKNFTSTPKEFAYLSDFYLSNHHSNWLKLKSKTIRKIQNLFGYAYYLDEVDYEIRLNYLPKIEWEDRLDEISLEAKNVFLDRITNNDLFVSDDYYSTYLIDENGKERSSLIENIDINNSEEYKDFKMVVKYLKEKKVKASFIILPLNPYYYRELQLLDPLIDSITSSLAQENIPYYNMFVSSKEDYEPGLLRDVMHIGDYGWMKVNKYLDSLYYGN